MTVEPPVTVTPPASLSHFVLSHFVIFNPTLQVPAFTTESDDKDLEDDLREAAQILFYTSREAGGVSRDRMLRQVGLAKGLMSFTDMVTTNENGKDEKNWYSIHSHRSRLFIYSPEPDFFIYMNVTLALNPPAPPQTASSSSSSSSKSPAEPFATTAQGLSDRIIVDALSRGYEDFRLLHGPLPSHLSASSHLSTLLDKFWTRFAFAAESTFLSPNLHFPSILTDWLGGYPAPSEEVSQGLPRAVEVFREDGEAEEGSIIGIVGKNGPIHVDDKAQLDPALLRYVFNLVQASLPPPRPLSDTATSKTDARQSLGLGLGRRKKDDPSRRSSWTNLGWMPGLGTGLSSTSSPAPAALAPPQTASSRVHEPSGPSGSGVDALAMPSKDTKTRWPSLGLGSLGGLGEAMGSMGSALGMGSSPRSYQGPHMAAAAAHASPDPSARVETQESSEPPFSGEVKQPASTANASMQSIESEDLDKAGVSAGANEVDTTVLTTASSSDAAAHHVEQSSVALPDLHAAVQADSQVDLTWDGRGVWVRDLMDRGAYVKRRLSWIIRDSVLLFVLLPCSANQPWPTAPNGPTLSLYSKLATVLTPNRPSVDLSSPSTPVTGLNSSIYHTEDGMITEQKGPEMDPASASTLADLRDVMECECSISEIYARTPASKFVVAKRTRTTSSPNAPGDEAKARNGGELYMLVGRKDASLTDAEHAVRGFARSRAEFAL